MDKLELPSSGPSLELPLALDHRRRPIKLFDIHQPRDPIFPGETFDQPLLVLEEPAPRSLVEPIYSTPDLLLMM
jgi:hypothetical protein